jgi:hypothetical protein
LGIGGVDVGNASYWLIVQDFHTPGLKLGYESAKRFSAQRVTPKVNGVSITKPRVVDEGGDVAYLVTPKIQSCQAGEV